MNSADILFQNGTSPSAIQYQLSHANDNNACGLVDFCVVGICIICVACVGRLASRKVFGAGFHRDDIVLCLAAVLSCATISMILVNGIQYGLGRHWLSLAQHEKERTLAFYYAYCLLVSLSYPLARISIALTYQPVLVRAWSQTICWCLIFIYTAFMLANFLVQTLSVLPIKASWDPDVLPTHQIDRSVFDIFTIAFNIATDTVLIILSIFVARSLTLANWQKLGVLTIFVFALLALACAALRMVYLLRTTTSDFSYTVTPLVAWTAAELVLSILVPSLIAFGPMIDSAIAKLTGRSSHRPKSNFSHKGSSSFYVTDESVNSVHAQPPVPQMSNIGGPDSPRLQTVEESPDRSKQDIEPGSPTSPSTHTSSKMTASSASKTQHTSLPSTLSARTSLTSTSTFTNPHRTSGAHSHHTHTHTRNASGIASASQRDALALATILDPRYTAVEDGRLAHILGTHADAEALGPDATAHPSSTVPSAPGSSPPKSTSRGSFLRGLARRASSGSGVDHQRSSH